MKLQDWIFFFSQQLSILRRGMDFKKTEVVNTLKIEDPIMKEGSDKIVQKQNAYSLITFKHKISWTYPSYAVWHLTPCTVTITIVGITMFLSMYSVCANSSWQDACVVWVLSVLNSTAAWRLTSITSHSMCMSLCWASASSSSCSASSSAATFLGRWRRLWCAGWLWKSGE